MPKKKANTYKPSVKPILRILCEGEKTEPIYLNAFIDSLSPSKFGKPKVEKTVKNTPVQLVEEAIKRKESIDNNDIYWVVYDRESEYKYSDSLHLKAREKAENHNINIAFSNVCFEYWLLLHFDYTSASYNSCDDLLNNSDFKQLLKTIGIMKYNKGDVIAVIFDKLKDRVSVAEHHAEQLRKDITSSAESRKSEPYQLNPYVDIDILLNNIRIFSNPFNDEVKKAFNHEFSTYYRINLPDKEWLAYLRNEASSSVKRLVSTIEPSILTIIVDTLINSRNHEINCITASSCNSNWVEVDKEWKVYKTLLEIMKEVLLN